MNEIKSLITSKITAAEATLLETYIESEQKSISIASAVVQIWKSEPPEHKKWTPYDIGVCCFVKDYSKQSYYFRLYDLFPEELWEQEIYFPFSLKRINKNWFCFAGETCNVALSFAYNNEADEFLRLFSNKYEQSISKRFYKKDEEKIESICQKSKAEFQPLHTSSLQAPIEPAPLPPSLPSALSEQPVKTKYLADLKKTDQSLIDPEELKEPQHLVQSPKDRPVSSKPRDQPLKSTIRNQRASQIPESYFIVKDTAAPSGPTYPTSKWSSLKSKTKSFTQGEWLSSLPANLNIDTEWLPYSLKKFTIESDKVPTDIKKLVISKPTDFKVVSHVGLSNDKFQYTLDNEDKSALEMKQVLTEIDKKTSKKTSESETSNQKPKVKSQKPKVKKRAPLPPVSSTITLPLKPSIPTSLPSSKVQPLSPPPSPIIPIENPPELKESQKSLVDSVKPHISVPIPPPPPLHTTSSQRVSMQPSPNLIPLPPSPPSPPSPTPSPSSSSPKIPIPSPPPPPELEEESPKVVPDSVKPPIKLVRPTSQMLTSKKLKPVSDKTLKKRATKTESTIKAESFNYLKTALDDRMPYLNTMSDEDECSEDEDDWN